MRSWEFKNIYYSEKINLWLLNGPQKSVPHITNLANSLFMKMKYIIKDLDSISYLYCSYENLQMQ